MIGFLILLTLLPLEIVQNRSAHFRSLPLLEQVLRRASHPLGVVTLVLFGFFMVPAWRGLGGMAAEAVASNGVTLLILLAVSVYGLANLLVGFARCRNARDGLYAVRGFIKLVFGLGAGWLWFFYPWRTLTAELPAFVPGEAWFLIGVWLFTTGAVRFLLMTIDGGNALAIARRIMRRRNAPMRPARW